MKFNPSSGSYGEYFFIYNQSPPSYNINQERRQIRVFRTDNVCVNSQRRDGERKRKLFHWNYTPNTHSQSQSGL